MLETANEYNLYNIHYIVQQLKLHTGINIQYVAHFYMYVSCTHISTEAIFLLVLIKRLLL